MSQVASIGQVPSIGTTRSECSGCHQRLINKVYLSCGHIFHSLCVQDWLEKNRSAPCPSCRSQVTHYYPANYIEGLPKNPSKEDLLAAAYKLYPNDDYAKHYIVAFLDQKFPLDEELKALSGKRSALEIRNLFLRLHQGRAIQELPEDCNFHHILVSLRLIYPDAMGAFTVEMRSEDRCCSVCIESLDDLSDNTYNGCFYLEEGKRYHPQCFNSEKGASITLNTGGVRFVERSVPQEPVQAIQVPPRMPIRFFTTHKVIVVAILVFGIIAIASLAFNAAYFQLGNPALWAATGISALGILAPFAYFIRRRRG